MIDIQPGIAVKEVLDRLPVVDIIAEFPSDIVRPDKLIRGRAYRIDSISRMFNMWRLTLPSTNFDKLFDLFGIKRAYLNVNYSVLQSPIAWKVNTWPIRTDKYIWYPPSYIATKVLHLDTEFYVTNSSVFKTTGESSKVAIIDSGITKSNIRMKAKIYSENALGLLDWNGHGTHVTSIACAPVTSKKYRHVTGTIDMHGISPRSDVMCANALLFGSGTTADIIKAIEYSYRNGYRLFNLSLGTDIDPSKYNIKEDALVQYIEKLTDNDKSCIFVCAAGNSGPNTVSSPAVSDRVIAVGSVSLYEYENGMGLNRSFFSSYGSYNGRKIPDVVNFGGGRSLKDARPQEYILAHSSSVLDVTDEKVDGFAVLHGTSQATPVVTGMLALIQSVINRWNRVTNAKKTLTYEKVRFIISKQGWKNDQIGYGLFEPELLKEMWAIA